MHFKILAALCGLAGMLAPFHAIEANQSPDILPPSLKTVPAPLPDPALLAQYVRDKKAAIALGKVLFWDSQVGSDGLACASCHFQAGADNRVKNQLNPGLRNELGSPIATTFDPTETPSGGPNHALKAADFPFHRLSDELNRNSDIVFDSDDVVSSQGVFRANYTGLTSSQRQETCDPASPTTGAPLFSVGGVDVRQVEPRNTPTVINAVYNFRNFWDGRANHVFNGLDPFGMRRPFDANGADNIRVVDAATGALVPFQVAIPDASLASQAVGPALSDFEMSCGNKTFPALGHKLMAAVPLVPAKQKVDITDGVLGTYAAPDYGLKPKYTYRYLIQQAFQPKFWQSSQTVGGYTLMENNFSLFWGLAIMLYESTLVSDDSRYDQYRAGTQFLNDQEVRGINLFVGKGKCIACHFGPEFTSASTAHVKEAFLERMLTGDGTVKLYDSGFYNIGVRPTVEDLGVGANDPYGNPLSHARLAKQNATGEFEDARCSEPFQYYPTYLGPDPICVYATKFMESQGLPVDPSEVEAVDGAFKTPSLRNVELTGPFFHNGGYATLEQAVRFYNRGGDRRDQILRDDNGEPILDPLLGIPVWLGDSSGYGPNASNLDPDLAGAKDPLAILFGGIQAHTLELSDEEIADLVAFLKTLTDERVRWEKAPFDHPALKIPNGHPGDETAITTLNTTTGRAADTWLTLPAVGAAGRAAKNLPPLLPFEAGLR